MKRDVDRLNLVSVLARVAAILAFLAAAGVVWAVLGQGPAPVPVTTTSPPVAGTVPEFEAATIKRVKDVDPNRKTDREEGRRFIVDNRTLAELLTMAYHLDRRQIAGGPAWIATDTYDLVAVAESDAALKEDGRAMFQKLLTDRFQLAFHWEQREMPVYVMTVAKGGPNLTVADGAGVHTSSCQRAGQCMLRREDMQHFASWLQSAVLDKPVVDKTGLAGEFDFALKWTPDQREFFSTGSTMAPPPIDDPNAPPGLYQAMEDQLGLKLDAQKTSTQVLVIDHVERPSEN